MSIARLHEKRDFHHIELLAVFAALSHWSWHFYYSIFFPEVTDFLSTRLFLCSFAGAGYYLTRYKKLEHKKIFQYFHLGLWLFLLNEALLVAVNHGSLLFMINFLAIGLIVSTSVLRFRFFISMAIFTVLAPVLIHFFYLPYETKLLLHWLFSTSTVFVVVGYLVKSNFNYRDEVKTSHIGAIQSSKMAALGEMSAGMAHEINTPLAVIKGKADQILMKTISDSPIDRTWLRSELGKIAAHSERIAKIIRSLRAFSRNSDNDPMMTVSVQMLIDSTLELCSEKIKARHVEIQVLNSANISIPGRESELSQVLLNLISNSIDALEIAPVKKIEIISLAIENFLLLKIRDSGSPIPDSIKEKLMDPFFTTKEPGKGTGLGLSISKGILESHGGRLYLDITETSTCFVMELPIHGKSKLTSTPNKAA